MAADKGGGPGWESLDGRDSGAMVFVIWIWLIVADTGVSLMTAIDGTDFDRHKRELSECAGGLKWLEEELLMESVDGTWEEGGELILIDEGGWILIDDVGTSGIGLSSGGTCSSGSCGCDGSSCIGSSCGGVEEGRVYIKWAGRNGNFSVTSTSTKLSPLPPSRSVICSTVANAHSSFIRHKSSTLPPLNWYRHVVGVWSCKIVQRGFVSRDDGALTHTTESWSWKLKN